MEYEQSYLNSLKQNLRWHITWFQCHFCIPNNLLKKILTVSCQKGPTRHAYAWQIGPFWQDALDIPSTFQVQLTLKLLKYWVSNWFLLFNTCIWLLTHWCRVTHTCVGNLTIIGSDNVLSSGQRQAIIWTNTGILLIGPSGTNFSELSIKIQTFSFKKNHLKVSSAKWRPFCVGLNELTHWCLVIHA